MPERQFQLFLDQIPGLVYLKDTSDIFLDCSRDFLSFLGFLSFDDVLGKNTVEVLSHKFSSGEIETLKHHEQKVIDENQALVFEETLIQDGRLSYFLTTRKPFEDNDGNVIGVLSNSVDITHQQQKQNAYFKNIVENMPGSICWKDLEGRFLGCNQFAADIAGLASPNDLIGKTDFELNSWKSNAEIYRMHDQEVIRTGKKLFVEEPVTTMQGEVLTFQGVKAPLRDETGAITGVLILGIDVTDRKKLEFELKIEKQKSDIYLNNIVENMPGSICWKDIDGRFLGCNQFHADMAGLQSPEDLIGKTDYEFCWKNNADIYRMHDQMVIQTGKKIMVEEPVTLNTGETLIFQGAKSPLRDENGDIVGVLILGVDITERKKLEAELAKTKEQAEAYLKNAVEHIPGSIYWKDLQGVYQGCNSSFVKIAGVAAVSELIGKTDEQLPWSDKAEEMHQLDNAVIQKNETLEMEEVKKLPNGEQQVWLTKKTALHDHAGQVIGIISISFDITDRKRHEDEKIEMMLSLAASIAHEIRTPLATISINANTLGKHIPVLMDIREAAIKAAIDAPTIDDGVAERLQKVPAIIRKETQAGNLFVDMLLMNLKPEIGSAMSQVCSIVECVNEALERYPFQGDDRALIIWQPEADFLFRGKKLLVVHILFNLIKNALFYIAKAQKGQIIIWSEAHEHENALYFEDSGMGIGKDILPHIFNQFFSKTYHGAGIGLTYCKMVMESLGGEISCESEEGEYTRFILKFPVCPP